MELPIVAPAPVVTDHAAIFRDLFENQCQFRHVQHDLTGLIVLPNKSLASICGSRKPVATVNRQVGTRVITPLAAHSDDATHPPLRLP
jgi:hypothetical protein